ncbi:MAG: hypothetical protein KUF77_12605 [Candidatus Thiodiazotropha sp. (ex Lucina aurantia)]|nr:hypothetical protein [Candidatus Thiodiazotropha sp. (ex Lucina pensylvanica)]MBT3024688.1 hypothetical protein [Candidatus Thiodiazotropha taylori]MBV2098826.1 hypothetical protein [Candidatus Thiodiazotropha sp. (ex Codakia orbicularis)]MBV2103858.1 hypothetical protein [Candidatus Thiodiazotropha sp. (ex Lucina aurantia)]MBV2118271.1 hypothetical protein [Candidatus Thiodiazotropha sp. (ex Lucina aurantia)]
MNERIALALLLFMTGTANALVKEGHAEVTGYKKSGKNAYHVIYRIYAPNKPLHNVWLEIDLKTAVFGHKNKRFADPEQAVCRLKINQYDKPAAEYAQYLGSSLYFYFDRLEKFSVVQFSIGWKNPADAEGPVPEYAVLEIKSDEWEKAAAWEPPMPRLFPIVSDAQITIQDGISCNLY